MSEQTELLDTRDPALEVMMATRLAIDMAYQEPRVSNGALSLLLLIVRELSTWSRASQCRTVSWFARVRYGKSNRNRERDVAGWLRELHDRGCIHWWPGRHEGQAGTIALPHGPSIARLTLAHRAATVDNLVDNAVDEFSTAGGCTTGSGLRAGGTATREPVAVPPAYEIDLTNERARATQLTLALRTQHLTGDLSADPLVALVNRLSDDDLDAAVELAAELAWTGIHTATALDGTQTSWQADRPDDDILADWIPEVLADTHPEAGIPPPVGAALLDTLHGPRASKLLNQARDNLARQWKCGTTATAHLPPESPALVAPLADALQADIHQRQLNRQRRQATAS